MALENYASTNPDKVHTDVLSEARQACHKARDAFYKCLEKESNKKPTEIASVGLLYPVECKKSRTQFVSQCRPTWVKHFDRQYCSKKRVQRLLDDNESRRAEFVGEASHPNSSTDQIANSLEYPLWLAGESQAVDDADENGLHDSLLCKEIFYPCAPLYDSGLNPGPVIGFSHNMNGMPGDHNAPCGIADLENLELDTPPDFQLADLQFGSQDSIFGWLDRL